jgi:hypothetical protein
MLRSWKFLVLSACVIANIGLMAVNAHTFQTNRALQAEVAARQQYIDESVRLSQFSNQFIQALANLAAQTSDESFTRLLADHGVTFTVTPRDLEGEGGADE